MADKIRDIKQLRELVTPSSITFNRNGDHSFDVMGGFVPLWEAKEFVEHCYAAGVEDFIGNDAYPIDTIRAILRALKAHHNGTYSYAEMVREIVTIVPPPASEEAHTYSLLSHAIGATIYMERAEDARQADLQSGSQYNAGPND